MITGASAGVGRATARAFARRGALALIAREPVRLEAARAIAIAPDRPDDLHAPLAGERGSHGIFDEQATGRSYVWWATKRRPPIALGGAVPGALAALVAWRARCATRRPLRSAARRVGRCLPRGVSRRRPQA